jgi:hypothetical protein
MKLRTLSISLLLLLTCSDAVSSHTKRKQLRRGAKLSDVDDDNDDSADDDDDSDDQQPAAPAAAEVSAPAVAEEAAPAPAPLNPGQPPLDPPVPKHEEAVADMGDMMKAAHEMFEDYDIKDPQSVDKEELAGVLFIEDVYRDKLETLENDNYEKRIAAEAAPVASETNSSGLADMLSDMREEMHDYALPFYKKYLKEKIEESEKKQKALLKKIEAEKHGKVEVKEKKAEVKTEKKEEKSDDTAKKEPKTMMDSNNIMFLLAIVVVLAVLAFLLARNGSRRAAAAS